MNASPASRALAIAAMCSWTPCVSLSQKPGAGARDTTRDTTLASGITAGESDGEKPRRQLIKALNMNLGFTTLSIGGGLLVDFTMFDQDSASLLQFGRIPSIGKLRDFR